MNEYIRNLVALLPRSLADCLLSYRTVYELRLRPGRKAVVVTDSGRYVCGQVWSEQEFEHIFLALAGGNRYQHETTLLRGYFTDIFGGRCGVACDRASCTQEQPYVRVRSLNLRIPRFVPTAADELFDRFCSHIGGVLVYGPPRAGKTTVIRALAGRLSAPPVSYGVCVCDERHEFSERDYAADCNLDILSGYAKKQAIEIALRSLSPDVIICDEIGDYADADGIGELAGSGVPLIATVHARTEQELLSKGSVRMLQDKHLFRTYARLTGIRNGVTEFEFTDA